MEKQTGDINVSNFYDRRKDACIRINHFLNKTVWVSILSYCFSLKRNVSFKENNLWFFALLQDVLRVLPLKVFSSFTLELYISVKSIQLNFKTSSIVQVSWNNSSIYIFIYLTDYIFWLHFFLQISSFNPFLGKRFYSKNYASFLFLVFNFMLRLMFPNFLSLAFLASDWCIEYKKRTWTHNILVDILNSSSSPSPILWLSCRLVTEFFTS